jgi:hypothetical protein
MVLNAPIFKKGIEMSLKKVVEEGLKQQAALLDPSASHETKGKLVISLLGGDTNFWKEIGKIVSRKVATRKATARKPVEAPKKPELVKMPTPAVQTAMAPAPARELKPKWEDLFKVLSSFARTGGAKLSLVREEITKMFRSGFKLDKSQWEVFFSAMRKALEKNAYILHRDVCYEKVFEQAPKDLLDQYVFGLDGLMVITLSELKVTRGEMAPSLIAKNYTLAAALEVLPLGNQEAKKVEDLLDQLERVMGPRKLCDKVAAILRKIPKREGKRSGPMCQSNAMAVAMAKALETKVS